MKKISKRIACFFILFLSFYIVSPSIDRSFPEWTYKARIAGYAVEPDESDEEIDETLESFKEQNVSVIIADCPIGWDYSSWYDENEFQKNLNLIKKVVKKAHEKGLKVVWYLTGLEISSKERNPSKENPDWL